VLPKFHDGSVGEKSSQNLRCCSLGWCRVSICFFIVLLHMLVEPTCIIIFFLSVLALNVSFFSFFSQKHISIQLWGNYILYEISLVFLEVCIYYSIL